MTALHDPNAAAEVMEGYAYFKKAPRLMEILEAVCTVYGVGKMDVASSRRWPHMVEARHAFYWLARHLTPRSYPEIGRFLGGHDHCTVWKGMRRMDKRLRKNKAQLEAVAARLGVSLPVTIDG